MKFAVYSKDGCPYCSKVKQVLELTKQQFVVYNLGVEFTKEQFYAEFGQGATFPQVICDGPKTWWMCRYCQVSSGKNLV